MAPPRRSFLDIIKRARNGGKDSGDEFGGAAGSDGSGLPTGKPGNFMFATGIECSYPTIHHGRVRRDLLEECGHYRHWKQDLALVRRIGLKVLRYGLPYYRIHLGPGRYQWDFADNVMREMKRLRITPILDLLHFGLPRWIGSFQNPELPVLFQQYADAVAERYPWVRYYTPVNEIYVTAKMSAKDGLWNEQLTNDRAFVTAIKHLVAANTLACHAIAKRRPDAIIIANESAEFTHEARAEPSSTITLENNLRFAAMDLLYAHPPDAEVLLFLLDNGLTRDEYAWKMRGEPPGYQVLGLDYYGRNEHIITPDGVSFVADDVMGWYQIALRYYERYKKPVMHTETNVFDAKLAPIWLWKQWVNILRMRAHGVPVLGFTWYSLIDQVDWDIGLTSKRGRINKCGLYDLKRKARPVASAYKALLKEFGQITIVPHGELFEVSDQPARLKVEV